MRIQKHATFLVISNLQYCKFHYTFKITKEIDMWHHASPINLFMWNFAISISIEIRHIREMQILSFQKVLQNGSVDLPITCMKNYCGILFKLPFCNSSTMFCIYKRRLLILCIYKHHTYTLILLVLANGNFKHRNGQCTSKWTVQK